MSVYRPPEGHIKNFCDKLEDQLICLKNKYDIEPEIFIMGDCNIDYLKPGDPSTKLLKWIEHSTGLRQLMKQPTRYSTTNSCIDLIFTNCNKVKCSNIHDYNVSDHQMISLTRKHLSKPTISDSFLGQTYKNNNKENFQTILNNQNWETFYKCGNPSQAWSILSNIILSVIDNNIFCGHIYMSTKNV